MRSAMCVSSCMFTSLKQLISEHFSYILAAGVVGALFGLVYAGGEGALAGAGIGLVLATIYGHIPRMADCVRTCPLR